MVFMMALGELFIAAEKWNTFLFFSSYRSSGTHCVCLCYSSVSVIFTNSSCNISAVILWSTKYFVLFNIVLLFLDYEDDTKESDDILDIMLRWNSFNNLKVTFKSYFQEEIRGNQDNL